MAADAAVPTEEAPRPLPSAGTVLSPRRKSTRLDRAPACCVSRELPRPRGRFAGRRMSTAPGRRTRSRNCTRVSLLSTPTGHGTSDRARPQDDGLHDDEEEQHGAAASDGAFSRT